MTINIFAAVYELCFTDGHLCFFYLPIFFLHFMSLQMVGLYEIQVCVDYGSVLTICMCGLQVCENCRSVRTVGLCANCGFVVIVYLCGLDAFVGCSSVLNISLYVWKGLCDLQVCVDYGSVLTIGIINKGNNKITELGTILQRESQNS